MIWLVTLVKMKCPLGVLDLFNNYQTLVAAKLEVVLVLAIYIQVPNTTAKKQAIKMLSPLLAKWQDLLPVTK